MNGMMINLIQPEDRSLCVLRDNGNVNRVYYRDERSDWQGNIGTYEEMITLSNRRICEHTLKLLSAKYPDVEWDGHSRHWYWAWNHFNNTLQKKYSITVDNGGIYFPTKDTLDKVLTVVGKDYYLIYLLGVKGGDVL